VSVKKRALGPSPSRKVMQVVWVPEELFIKVVDYAASRNVAYNVAIVEILREYFEGVKSGAVQTVNTVRTLLVCPACNQSFSNMTDFKVHVHRDRSHVKKFFEEVI
jgi:uncharacterized C2H2 Zn-finger protein